MQWKVPLFATDFGAAELEAVQVPLRAGWLTSGPMVARFEEALAERLGVRHAIAVSNGTAALHLMLAAAGVGPGDEVIVPTLTFVATASAVRQVGATPVFAEALGEHNLNIGPATIAPRITPRTRAILAVHYAGFAADLPGVLALAEQHGLIVLEDCAHALVTRLRGRMCGAWGLASAFSFYGNKNLTCGEGGLVATDSDALSAHVRRQRELGMSPAGVERHAGRALTCDVAIAGLNCRMDEIRAALGLAQLARLPEFLRERSRVRRRYEERLTESPVRLPHFDWAALSQPGDFVGHHILPALLPAGAEREAVARFLRERGIQTSVHYRPVHTLTAFRGGGDATPPRATEALAARELTLPMYPTLRDEQVDLVCETLLAALAV